MLVATVITLWVGGRMLVISFEGGGAGVPFGPVTEAAPPAPVSARTKASASVMASAPIMAWPPRLPSAPDHWAGVTPYLAPVVPTHSPLGRYDAGRQVTIGPLPPALNATAPLSPAPVPDAGLGPDRLPAVRTWGLQPSLPFTQPHPSRWSTSAWLALRNGNGDAPGQAASLGGSQSGLRLAYRLDTAGRWRAFTRIVSVGRGMRGAEGALGLEWQPRPALPVRIVAERREALFGSGGRSAMAGYVVAGVDDRAVVGPWRAHGYAAAGAVGLSRRDLFAEASLRLDRPLIRHGPLRADTGIGLWGAVQPGVQRVDVGPTLTIRHDASPLRLSLEWRQRVVGQAEPGSGPALTLSTDF